MVIPASQKGNQGSEQLKVPPKSDLVLPVFTQVYTSVQDSYFTHSICPKGKKGNNILGGPKWIIESEAWCEDLVH